MNIPPDIKGHPDSGNGIFVQTLFERQQEETPDLTAVYSGGDELSYAELNRLANRLSDHILSHSPDSGIVGISTTRCIEMIVGVLAILKAGKAYLPLNPDYPQERLRQMIADAGIDTCLCTESEFSSFRSLEAGIRLLAMDGNPADVPVSQVAAPPSSLAYILYTSGSTGKPKGVCMGHAPLVNLLSWQRKHSVAGKGTKTLQFAPLSFDVSFQEIFATLTTGGTLVMIGDDLRLDPRRLLEFIQEQSVNRIFLPFVALQYLTEAADTHRYFPASLKEVITAGEQLKITPQVVRFFSSLPSCILYNQYGPTECHVVTEMKLEGDPAAWPALPSIGSPIDHTGIHILDEQLHELPAGKTGELCISGESLAEGYLNHPELTAEKFTNWHSSPSAVLRIYKTGDLARYLPDGNIELLGRKDDQVKIRGYRIELGEIEIALTREAGIRQAVVVVREDVPSQKRLIAYLVSSDGLKDTAALRSSIERQLPDYMMPSAFVWMDELPKTSSGKVDKKLLPKPEIKRPELAVLYQAPVTQIEKRIAALWASLLQLDKVGVNDNFFELGGNSLLALKTAASLKEEYRYDLPVTRIYQYPTVSGIAAWLGGGKKKIARQAPRNRTFTSGSRGDVAVIAMAGRFPGANTLEELWTVLKEGRETISFFSNEELDAYIPREMKADPDYVKTRGIIDHADEFDASFFGINPSVAELMDPQQRVFLEIAWEALESGGYLPGKFSGTTGVFAGIGNNTYYLNNVLGNKERIARVGSFQVMTLNEKDYIATRTAYELDLKGPAVSVHTACSTSLLAITQAVESIRKGQCDLALAGGVAITVPVKSGHLYQEGGMYSPDGHCRSFDADAQGTVFSDGAGVVLLKNREDAERDGDTIYAVIKGVGVNNDGGGKGSFTAPSAEGQAGAIMMAIEDAAVAPGSISYVEAHGTATPLGDPIEIEGLSIAFGDPGKKQYCALGSIKSNMGHLTAAAGVAGFIKTALALYHKQIPPSINFERPNPNIDFERSPFFVNTQLREWQFPGKRRAGISSFGVGGTNVHVVLEEFEKPEPSAPVTGETARPSQLICWSAKTVKSRDAYAVKLADWLKANESVHVADVAYTLQTSRDGFNARRFAIAEDGKELYRKLNDSPSISETKLLEETGKGLVFLFPGQGSQALNMGLELYQQEPVFRQAVDECAIILKSVMSEDIRAILYPERGGQEAEEKINNTYYTQPALFVTEYAMAKLWMSWGVQPAVFIGHSIGEFVAAHLAGVFSLEDGLHLIAARGRLMAGLPGGSMLSIRAGYEKIESLLPAELSLAAINSPALCVVAGPVETTAAFSKQLSDEAISNKLLHTSHAFHSSMMDSIVEPFERITKSVSLHLPRIPIVSTVTGNWMTDAEATDPSYWAQHLRRTVRFSNAVTTALEEGYRMMLESGPRNVASTLVRQHAFKKPVVAISCLDGEEGKPACYSVLKALGQLWLNGIQPDWEAFYNGQKRTKLKLPTYAFDRTRYWVNPVLPLQATVPDHPVPGVSVPGGEGNIENNLPQNSVMRKTILIEKVKEILENASGIELEGVSPDMNFIEIGFDSLLLTQVALNLKKEFGLPVSFRQLNEQYGSLDLLASFLDANLPPEKFQPRPAATVTASGSYDNPASLHRAGLPAATGGENPAIGLISRQIQLLAEQVALLQQSGPVPVKDIRPPVSETVMNKGGSETQAVDLSSEEIKELKKPFGASARIEKQSTALDKKQQDFLDELIRRYNQKTKRSKDYTQEHRAYMADPRVVSGFRPLTKEIVYPLVVNRSKGSHLWDIDGNDYIDALNGFGSNMLGYQPEIVTRAIQQQISEGYELGPQHELAGPVCKLICEFTGQDRAALCNTGSEAVLGAMRIARTVTGRSTIVAFSGSYHGINDEVIIRGTRKLKSFPAAPGIMPEAVQNMLILDYGTEESLAIIRERAHEFAAVLVEPVQSRRPDFQPVEFLKELRKITEESGSALIFDEVITGFRMHPGGAQALFGIKADLGTYGKVVASGIPVGVIAGRKQFMDALDGGFWKYGDVSTPEAGVTYFAGTFVRHPMALAASRATLEYMKEKGPGLQEALNSKTKGLADRLNGICLAKGLPLYVPYFGSLWKLKFKEEIPYTELLFTLMREKGIHILDGFPCFLTEAHTEKEVDLMVEKFEESANELIAAGFLPSAKKVPGAQEQYKVEEIPPVPGAKLGRDKEGNPAWFITDPSRPGKYMQVN